MNGIKVLASPGGGHKGGGRSVSKIIMTSRRLLAYIEEVMTSSKRVPKPANGYPNKNYIQGVPVHDGILGF